MSARITALERPPIGFVVEGRGEYNCYPSLVCRVVGASGFKVPRVNAGGYGNIVRHLRDQLDVLTLAHHPFHIIVTMDLRDILDDGLYTDCAQLCDDLQKQARDWLRDARDDTRLHPLPGLVSIVVQVPKFESWMAADIPGLVASGYLQSEPPQCSNVDDEIRDPATWLSRHVTPGRSLKNPRSAKCVVSRLSPTIMREHSRSFDKFCREVESAYDCWSQACRVLCEFPNTI